MFLFGTNKGESPSGSAGKTYSLSHLPRGLPLVYGTYTSGTGTRQFVVSLLHAALMVDQPAAVAATAGGEVGTDIPESPT